MTAATEISSAKKVVDGDDDPNFDRKLETVTGGTKPFVKEHIFKQN